MPIKRFLAIANYNMLNQTPSNIPEVQNFPLAPWTLITWNLFDCPNTSSLKIVVMDPRPKENQIWEKDPKGYLTEENQYPKTVFP
jgi:hypothetical protein